MSSYRGQQQVSRPASLPGALHPQLAQQHCGQNHSTPKLDSGLEDEVDTDTDDIDLQQQHAELYDSEADDKDEQWMQQQRQGRQSDAILSCPGCLTTVCIDCQRHEFYTTQYRAMFVMNCRISTAAKQSTVSDQTKLGKRQRQSGSRQPTAKLKQDIVYPVHCEVCNAELGIQDADEVVHFFHTFPSTA